MTKNGFGDVAMAYRAHSWCPYFLFTEVSSDRVFYSLWKMEESHTGGKTKFQDKEMQLAFVNKCVHFCRLSLLFLS
jgi:hypothetical protein